jgi:hypothetical protein
MCLTGNLRPIITRQLTEFEQSSYHAGTVDLYKFCAVSPKVYIISLSFCVIVLLVYYLKWKFSRLRNLFFTNDVLLNFDGSSASVVACL